MVVVVVVVVAAAAAAAAAAAELAIQPLVHEKIKLAIQPLVQHETIQINNTASCTTRDNTNKQYSPLYNMRQ
jgi:hypothetical protein